MTARIYIVDLGKKSHEQMDKLLKKEPKLFFPSSGTEGFCILDLFCANCIRDPISRNPNAVSQCGIIERSMNVGPPIKQWIYDEDGKPTCTSFRHYQDKKQIHKKRIIKGQTTLF